ncbi:hypothetical protein OHA63_25845 [Streptomyces anulatus]|uniref:hypothetical protein n=1 Tax=Streptomyces anulatus TaxID=1892 RepID=UPI002E2FB2BE|nr:hypothetical protein [Streptomyces anulatus]
MTPRAEDEFTLFPESLGTLAPTVTRSKAGASTRLANRLFAASLAGCCSPDGTLELGKKPFDLRAAAPLPPLMRVYLYTITTHPSERQQGAYRIQITLPNKSRYFDTTDDAHVILAGYEPNLEVFALWDADAHNIGKGIPNSKGVQILEDTLLEAMSLGVARQTRKLRGADESETVVASRPDTLPEALELRWQLSIERLIS